MCLGEEQVHVQRPRSTSRRCALYLVFPDERPSTRLLLCADPDPALPFWSALGARFLGFDANHLEAVGDVLRRKQPWLSFEWPAILYQRNNEACQKLADWFVFSGGWSACFRHEGALNMVQDELKEWPRLGLQRC